MTGVNGKFRLEGPGLERGLPNGRGGVEALTENVRQMILADCHLDLQESHSKTSVHGLEQLLLVTCSA